MRSAGPDVPHVPTTPTPLLSLPAGVGHSPEHVDANHIDVYRNYIVGPYCFLLESISAKCAKRLING